MNVRSVGSASSLPGAPRPRGADLFGKLRDTPETAASSATREPRPTGAGGAR